MSLDRRIGSSSSYVLCEVSHCVRVRVNFSSLVLLTPRTVRFVMQQNKNPHEKRLLLDIYFSRGLMTPCCRFSSSSSSHCFKFVHLSTLAFVLLFGTMRARARFSISFM